MMKYLFLIVYGVLLWGCSYHQSGSDKMVQPRNNSALQYPKALKVAQMDDYFGIQVADPYRWLEDIDATETQAWVAAQQAFAERYLSASRLRQPLRERIAALWNYERYYMPFDEVNGRLFYRKNDGLQNQAILYVQFVGESQTRILLDPNRLSDDGSIALADYAISKDGKVLAYALSESGSDWHNWYFRDIESSRDFEEHLRWSKFSSVAWAPDNSGIYYARYSEPKPGQTLEQVNYNQKLYFHTLGQPQSEDRLVYARPDQPEWGFSPQITEDDRYLLLHIWHGTHQQNRFFYKDLSDPQARFVELLNNFDAEYRFIGNQSNWFYFETDLEAPKGRIIAVDIRHPALKDWREIIQESDAVIQRAHIFGERIVLERLKDVLSEVTHYALDGRDAKQLKLPGLGSTWDFSGNIRDKYFYLGFNSYIQTPAIYRYDISKETLTLFRKTQTSFNPEDFESKQVFFSSQDGERIPMMLSYKKGLQLNRNNPTLLYAYGGYAISLTPAFNPAHIAWMERGGIYAVANLRGGGEYGESWHRAGMLENKQTVFEDFYAAAEYLINQRYTSTPYLGIYGRSNGGLLVGAALTQRPDLFGVAIPAVGVMDMLRFHKFTIGWAWVSEYGSPDDRDDFSYIYRYSPLHNITPREYPPTMIMTADHDDRVVPSHSLKFTATLQEHQRSSAPIIARIESKTGHGSGKSSQMQIDEYADIFTFLLHNMPVDLHGVHNDRF